MNGNQIATYVVMQVYTTHVFTIKHLKVAQPACSSMVTTDCFRIIRQLLTLNIYMYISYTGALKSETAFCGFSISCFSYLGGTSYQSKGPKVLRPQLLHSSSVAEWG